ncbi:hypothetical protein GGI21_000939 [Coemansia aciculifera]|nr:hypothetical protein GGI21_000939 [Coemansia aciculifera]
MRYHSSFQLFPSLVVESILGYVTVKSTRLSFDDLLDIDEDCTEETRKLQMPLLWVRRNFRDIVYSRFCKVYGLDLCIRLGNLHARRLPWPGCLQGVEYPTHHLAKQLEIALKPWMLFAGKLTEQLSVAPYDGCSFPQAYLLVLHFVSDTSCTRSDIGQLEIDANIAAFVERLGQMASTANGIRIVGYYRSITRYDDDSPFVGALVKQLYQRFNCIAHIDGYPCAFSDLPQVDATRNLVHLDYNAEDGYELVTNLARYSVSTLKFLLITFSSVEDVSSLVQATEGGDHFAEYLHLHTLELRNHTSLNLSYGNGNVKRRLVDAKDDKLPVFLDAEPFSNLRELCIEVDYPFGDDTLFRGNSATLEYLDMQLFSVTSSFALVALVFAVAAAAAPAPAPAHQVDHVGNWMDTFGRRQVDNAGDWIIKVDKVLKKNPRP